MLRAKLERKKFLWSNGDLDNSSTLMTCSIKSYRSTQRNMKLQNHLASRRREQEKFFVHVKLSYLRASENFLPLR